MPVSGGLAGFGYFDVIISPGIADRHTLHPFYVEDKMKFSVSETGIQTKKSEKWRFFFEQLGTGTL